jgi:hypothetical protein
MKFIFITAVALTVLFIGTAAATPLPDHPLTGKSVPVTWNSPMHETTWYWAPGRAENKLLNTGQAETALNAVDVWEADCVGRGLRRNIDWIWSDSSPRMKLYRHFECFVSWTDYDDQSWEMETVLHVRGSQRFSLSS